MVKIASYNVENLFARPKAFRATDGTNDKIVKAYKEVSILLSKDNYTVADKNKIKSLFLTLDLYRKNSHGAIRRKRSVNPKWAWFRRNKGKFDKEPRDRTKDVEIIATGRKNWIGWVELSVESTNEKSVRMTAKVIKDVDADILCVIEAENRPSLVRFNKELLDDQYEHIMLVDGNDDRGIDVGIMCKSGYKIDSIVSNVDTKDNTGEIFSRDCPQYEVSIPGGKKIHILINHFKSQSGGGGEKRKRQADAVRKISDELVSEGKHVVVLGDLNEGPKTGQNYPDNFKKLFAQGTPLLDSFSLQNFNLGERPGTYDACGLSNRLDYVLISKSLKDQYEKGEIYRKGLWGSRKSRPTNWDTYPEMKASSEQASDHALVWVELNI